MPRLELVANVKKALDGWLVRENNCWTDSMVAFCWVKNPFKNWKTFVSTEFARSLISVVA